VPCEIFICHNRVDNLTKELLDARELGIPRIEEPDEECAGWFEVAHEVHDLAAQFFRLGVVVQLYTRIVKYLNSEQYKIDSDKARAKEIQHIYDVVWEKSKKEMIAKIPKVSPPK
jgi:hypothetical protein